MHDSRPAWSSPTSASFSCHRRCSTTWLLQWYASTDFWQENHRDVRNPKPHPDGRSPSPHRSSNQNLCRHRPISRQVPSQTNHNNNCVGKVSNPKVLLVDLDIGLFMTVTVLSGLASLWNISSAEFRSVDSGRAWCMNALGGLLTSWSLELPTSSERCLVTPPQQIPETREAKTTEAYKENEEEESHNRQI